MAKVGKFFLLIFAFSLLFLSPTAKSFAADCSGFAPGTYYKLDKNGNPHCTKNELTAKTTENESKIGTISSYVQDTAKSLGWLSVGIAVCLIVYGGILYAKSLGESREIEKAKKLMFYSFIGMMIGLGSNVFITLVFPIIGVPTN